MSVWPALGMTTWFPQRMQPSCTDNSSLLVTNGFNYVSCTEPGQLLWHTREQGLPDFVHTLILSAVTGVVFDSSINRIISWGSSVAWGDSESGSLLIALVFPLAAMDLLIHCQSQSPSLDASWSLSRNGPVARKQKYLMKLLIEHDVMAGGPVYPQKHITVYGETRVTKFKLPATHELYHTFCISKKVVKFQSPAQLFFFVPGE